MLTSGFVFVLFFFFQYLASRGFYLCKHTTILLYNPIILAILSTILYTYNLKLINTIK